MSLLSYKSNNNRITNQQTNNPVTVISLILIQNIITMVSIYFYYDVKSKKILDLNMKLSKAETISLLKLSV